MWRTLRGCAAQLSPPRFDMIVSVNWKAIWLWRLWSKLWASPDDYELHSHVQKCVTFCFQFNIALADYELHSLNLLSISPSTESMVYCLFFCFVFFFSRILVSCGCYSIILIDAHSHSVSLFGDLGSQWWPFPKCYYTPHYSRGSKHISHLNFICMDQSQKLKFVS